MQKTVNATIVDPTVIQGSTQIQFSDICQLYVYGFTNGGLNFNSAFAQGTSVTITDMDGQVACGLAVSTSNSKSFTTQDIY